MHGSARKLFLGLLLAVLCLALFVPTAWAADAKAPFKADPAKGATIAATCAPGLSGSDSISRAADRLIWTL
ncbi:MAG: hypothetical protein HGA75_19355 [Thiobacillus sp.]|nr:hypothetical protein [Thiobacillus sp.]